MPTLFKRFQSSRPPVADTRTLTRRLAPSAVATVAVLVLAIVPHPASLLAVHFERLAHVAVFAVVGMLYLLAATDALRRLSGPRILGVVVVLALVALATEGEQWLLEGTRMDWHRLLADMSSVYWVLVLGWIWLWRGGSDDAPTPPAMGGHAD